MKIQLNHLLPAITTTLALMASPAGAAPLASDDFSSYDTNNIEFENGGTGWNLGYSVGSSEGFLNDVRLSAPTPPASPDPLNYPNYVSSEGNYANVASGFGGPTFNFIQRNVDVTGAFGAYNDGTRVGLDGTTLWGSFLYNKVNGMEFWLQGAGNIPFQLPTAGADSLFLFRIEFGAGDSDTITIWNNPNLPSWTPAATPTSVSISNYAFQSVIFVAPNDQNEGRFDDIRFGTTASDVVPYTPSGSGYSAWAMANGLDPLTTGAPGLDKDEDGATNLEEYAFFTNPNSGASLPSLITSATGSDITLTYLRANSATDVTYVPEVSTTLAGWTSVGLTDGPTGPPGVDTSEYVVTAGKGTDPAKFLRIRVTLPVAP